MLGCVKYPPCGHSAPRDRIHATYLAFAFSCITLHVNLLTFVSYMRRKRLSESRLPAVIRSVDHAFTIPIPHRRAPASTFSARSTWPLTPSRACSSGRAPRQTPSTSPGWTLTTTTTLTRTTLIPEKRAKRRRTMRRTIPSWAETTAGRARSPSIQEGGSSSLSTWPRQSGTILSVVLMLRLTRQLT